MTEEHLAIFENVKRNFESLGYTHNLLYESYEFTDILSPEPLVRSIPLAAFYQDPPSYHSACFGVCIANGYSGSSLVTQFRSLGAPQIFEVNSDGFISPMRGEGQLSEHAADYTIVYEDKTEVTIPILRRRQVGPFQHKWGDHCFDAVAHRSPYPQRASHERLNPEWGRTQTRVTTAPFGPWVNWL